MSAASTAFVSSNEAKAQMEIYLSLLLTAHKAKLCKSNKTLESAIKDG